MVQSLDANVGRVLQALDAAGLARDTIVVYTRRQRRRALRQPLVRFPA
jgi:hypothetical protein